MSLVAFDFDDTLCIDGQPNSAMIAVLERHHAAGDECHIVTARTMGHEYMLGCLWRTNVRDFVKKHGLPIKEIHFTAHAPKGPLLRQLNAVRIYDDCPHQLASADEYGIEAIDSKEING